jgi:ABC-type polysaccharide/polyol phosphate export permease
MGILRALGLLAKGCFTRDILQAPFRALVKHILLPAGVVCFFAFLHTDATARGGWPMLAIAGAVWLLFANSVRQGGMSLWHERWLLRDARIPAGLLLTAAALVPIGLFGVHVSLIHLALRASAVPQDATPVAVVLAGGIAAATGLGAGILAARLAGLRPNFASVLPQLLLASLILTPVFYRLSSLDGFGEAWCIANPLCAATELARAGISLEPEPLPRHATIVACGLSAAILCWGLLTLRLPSTSFAEAHD